MVDLSVTFELNKRIKKSIARNHYGISDAASIAEFGFEIENVCKMWKNRNLNNFRERKSWNWSHDIFFLNCSVYFELIKNSVQFGFQVEKERKK